MTQATITIEGMHCAACEKTITRALSKENITVTNISHKNGTATISYDTLDDKSLAKAIGAKGYRLVDKKEKNSNSKNLESKTLSKFAKKATTTSGYATSKTTDTWFKDTEKNILINGFFLLSILLVVQVFLAKGIYALMPGYKENYFTLFLYIPIAVVANVIGIWHQKAYRGAVSCMTGMMIGMTFGMTTGFMIGAIIGLTNGMFIGSVVGTLVGIIAGVYAGRCCGTMGVMEGMMAGLMGGTMGAMLTVMMITDHVLWFMPFLFGICILIVVNIMRVVVEEQTGTDADAKPWPLANVLAASFGIMLAISIIIMLAPKGLY